MKDPAELTVAEFVAGLVVALLAALMLTAYLADALGWPIHPAGVLVMLLAEALLVALWLQQCRRWPDVRLDAWELAGFAALVVGLFGYLLWQARPSLLPITWNGDLAYHLVLIDFIRQTGALPHDPSPYLAGMAAYNPGSHILAAFAADWLGTTSIRVLHPLLCLFVAVKAGMLYNLVLRLLPRRKLSPAIALGGPSLALLAPGYFLHSFTGWFFYAQVIAETFAVATLWALVRCHARPSPAILSFFALCGVGVFLTWPVWLPIPLAALAALLLGRRDVSLPRRVKWLAWTLAPIVMAGLIDVPRRTRNFSVVTQEGSVLAPFAYVHSWPLLLLVVIGVTIAVRNRRALPLLLFTAAAIAQTAALWAIQARNDLTSYNDAAMTSYYLTFKMFYLLLSPMVLFGALALDSLWRLPEGGRSLAWRDRFAAVAWILPMVMLVITLQRGLLSQAPSAITEPVYEAGLWAKAHLPNGCVDYLVDHWVTAYWLHINVLGNPLDSPRADAIHAKFGDPSALPLRGTDPQGLPFAIVSDLNAIQPEIRPGFTILYQSGSPAVVQRSDQSTCQDSTVPMDRYIFPRREQTLTRALDSLLPLWLSAVGPLPVQAAGAAG